MWKDLSFKDRSKLIELGASQGILDLSTIKHLYNINADGGYLKWKKEIAKHKGINIDNDNTYNYQAFFEEDPQRAWDMLKKDSKAHFTDKYKTVWHPTFSDESVYSGHKSKYNPQGLVGGHWEGNTFKMSDSLYNSPVSMDERQQYLIDNEPNGASLLESNGTLPVYDGIPWGGVLPEVTITPQYSDGGSIHIAKNKRGTFKAQASRMGMSTQQAASHILANKDNYSPAMVKKAVFAHNFAHADGGLLDSTIPEVIDNQHIFEDGGIVPSNKGKRGMTSPTRAHLVKRFWETDEEFKERTKGMTQEEIANYNKEVDKEYADMSKHIAEERAQALAEAKKNGTYPKPTIFEELGKASRKMHQSAKNSNSFDRLRRVTTGLENGVKKQVATAKGIAESAQNYANEQAEKKQQQMRDIKKGFNAAATLGELGAAGYAIGRLTVPRLLSNSTGVMGRVADFFTNNNVQLGANTVGSLADCYQLLTADNKFDKYENGIELGGDTAGIIGGLDIVRNSNIFGRYSRPIDTALDVTGVSASSWDILKNIPPFKYYYGKLMDYVNGTNETEDDNQYADGGSLGTTPLEAINNLHIFEDGGEYGNGGKKNKYSFMDKLKMSMMNTIPLIPDPTTFNAPFDNVTGNVNDRTSSVAQVSYLLSRDKQQKLFEDYGYKRVYNDYGTVKRAAESKGYPIYQKNSDDASRENLVPIGNADSDPFEVETTYKGKLMEVPTNWYAAPDKSLNEAGATRSTIYYNPDNGKYYQKAWDLNDYGGNGGSTADIFGKFLDTIGNPVVVTSGIQEVLPENINKVEKNYMLPYAKKHYLKKADNGHWGYVAPDVIIYGHKHAEGGFGDGGSLDSNEDNLLAPIIKYYEDSNPSLSIEDQNTFAKGGQMKRARQAVDYFVNKGLTREQAAGLVGNLMRESGMNIGATNPNSGAYGLSQWLGSRKTRLFKRYGYHPTFEQQLDYIWDELNTSHRRGLQMLRASKTVNDAARNAFGYYEFSAGPDAAIRAMNNSGKNTKWKNPNGTYALNSGIKNAQMIFGEVPVTIDNTGDTLTLDTPESTPNIQPIISNDYAPVTLANLKELPTFGQEEDNDSSISSFGPQYLAQNLDKLGMTNPLNPFEKGYQIQSPKAIYANMQGLI